MGGRLSRVVHGGWTGARTGGAGRLGGTVDCRTHHHTHAHNHAHRHARGRSQNQYQHRSHCQHCYCQSLCQYTTHTRWQQRYQSLSTGHWPVPLRVLAGCQGGWLDASGQRGWSWGSLETNPLPLHLHLPLPLHLPLCLHLQLILSAQWCDCNCCC